MQNIEVKILNPSTVKESEKMMVCAARLTQRGHTIKNMNDFIDLYEKDYNEKTVKSLIALPHPTIQKFGAVNIVVVGASRRFLAQITRHQNEVKFMSASLQYSDYSGKAGFVIPYSILEMGSNAVAEYSMECNAMMEDYQSAIEAGVDNDAAGYIAPQGLRNVLIISATPYQWKHMISQRSCNRNTKETQYIILKIWDELYQLAPEMFKGCGPFCCHGGCKEGKMSCGVPFPKFERPVDIINLYFPLLKGLNYEN